MAFWGLLVLAVVGSWAWLLYRDRFGDSDFFSFMLAPALTFLLGVLLFIAAVSKANVAGNIAGCEELRSNAAQVDIRGSEAILGRVADFNRDLAITKWQNRQWWGDPLIPDEWMSVEPIAVPGRPR
jgi:hypothetical protein